VDTKRDALEALRAVGSYLADPDRVVFDEHRADAVEALAEAVDALRKVAEIKGISIQP
jgi:hypothetical protein